ncbi:MAG: PQQ-binding-like beta-propeller repeat protein [Azoarcus sp.]|jgi:WD40 repeat protein/nucleoside phosphorylase|nr:PQQ-binding-like beta-propeller repeat protein [Azoarcus sp.]
MAAMQRLNAYYARKAVQKLELDEPLGRKIGDVLNLLDNAQGDRLRVSDLYRNLYPELSTPSANKALKRLSEQINAAAKGKGLGFEMLVSASKGTENRFLWFEGAVPEPSSPYTDDLNGIPAGRMYEIQGAMQNTVIALVTFNENETDAVLKRFSPGKNPVIHHAGNITYNDLGELSGRHVIHCVSQQGENRAQRLCRDLIEAFPFKIAIVIGVGIAFGVDDDKQKIGDVLVAKSLYDYECVRQGNSVEPRGGDSPCSASLIQHFLHLDHTLCASADHVTSWPTLHFGTLLSGNKLIDDKKHRDDLVSKAANVVGGEMEGLGIGCAVEGKNIQWLIVKAICDFADGNKNNPRKDEHQKLAAKHAADVVFEALRRLGPPGGGSGPRLTDLKKIGGRLVLESEGVPVSLKQDVENLASQRGGGDAGSVNVLETLKAWASQPQSPRCFALLGEYGMGKTIACQRLAKALHEQRRNDVSAPLALYFDLRHVTGLDKRLPTLAETLEECMERGWMNQNGDARFTLESLYLTLENQAAVVIFDGLDEVLVKCNEADGQTFSRNLLKIAGDIEARRSAKKIAEVPPLKILITCRTHYFRSIRDQNNHFTGQERGQFPAESFLAMLLLPLSQQQVMAYLASAFPELDAEKLLETIRAVHNLEELSQRPVTLKLIADYLPGIEADRADGKTVHGVALYERMASRWLERDAGKHRILPRHKMPLAMHLAAYLWREGSGSLEVGKLEDWLHEWLEEDPALERRYRNVSADQLEEDLRTATFLVREDGQKTARFRFAHTSLLEFFLAKYLFTAIGKNAPECWRMKVPSRETLDFLGQMLAEAEGGVSGWLQTVHEWGRSRRPQVNELILRYALLARDKGWPQPSLRGIDLSDADLQDFRLDGGQGLPLDLRGGDFSGANLRRTQFSGVDLQDCRFRNAALEQACFWDCAADRTDWEGAHCSGAIWHNVGLTESRWTGAQGKRPQFLFCQGMPFPVAGASWREAQVLPGGTLLQGAGGKVRTGFTAGAIHACAWSPDGGRLLLGDAGNRLIVWDAETGQKLQELRTEGHVLSCAWSPDGGRLLSGNKGNRLIVWDAETGQKLRELRAEGRVWLCAWSPDGGRLLSGDGEKRLIVWSAETGQKLWELRVEGSVRSCAWSPDGGRLLSVDGGNRLIVWDAETGQKLRKLYVGGSKTDIEPCAWSPDGRWLLLGDVEGYLIVVNAETGQTLQELRTGGSVESCAWSADGRRLLSGESGGCFRVWDVETRQKLRELWVKGSVESCAWSPNGGRLMSMKSGGCLSIWDAETGQKLRELRAEERVWLCAWSSDGGWLLSGDAGGRLIVWYAETGQKLWELRAEGGVLLCAWSPDGGRLLLGMEGDRRLIVWDAETGQTLRELRTGGSVLLCAWSPDGGRLLSGDERDCLIVSDAEPGTKLRALRQDAHVLSCEWSPDGGRLLWGRE